MEDLFPTVWLAKDLDGKKFDKKKEHGDATSFGKVHFAERVIRPNASKVDFAQFKELLARVVSCINHYKSTKASAAAVAVSPGVVSTGTI